ncbi:mediator of RNA polymerase II transcription subunit 14 [Rhodotorula diobovata]|uniref:Mediator of RNA polymerase II transcription subunit 14 n=1 Tax=Rhodotorula diobovata TaxID=5288 RepID=A0A5C5FWM0_9BASI|nr:mediator of RNA polymerase II transcription subunit 14 [Rhodotorula diobovata]
MDHMASSIVDDPPPLDAELPTVLHDLVPLSYLVDRVVSSAYSDLATLVETLPSHPDQHRKRALVDYVLHTRRQLVKLLVLTRWSTEAAPIHKAMNLVGFLSRQNHAVDSSVAALADTATMLAAARVRNYDLATALDVLTLGTYPSLPASLSDRFHAGAAAPLSDDQVLDTLRDVDDVLRWRLVMRREHVPEPMTRVPWRIGDGRVVFTVPGMWEATLTYGGGPEEDDEGQEQAEWFLLGVTFLFRVADARGSWAPTPTGPLKEHLVDLCNRQLLRRPYFPPPPPPEAQHHQQALADGAAGEESKAPAANGDGADAAEGKAAESDGVKAAKQSQERQEIVRKRRRDRPLDRAYTFLQRLALSYQLEAVYASAVRLAATSWSGHLRVEISPERDEVRVGYWTHKPEMPPQQQQRPSAPRPATGPGGTLVFSVRPAAGAPAGDEAARAAREGALRAALDAAAAGSAGSGWAGSGSVGAETAGEHARGLGEADGAAAVPAPLEVPPSLSITWLPPSSSSSSSAAPLPLSPTLLTAPPTLVQSQTPAQDLDIEPLLRRVTALHARRTVRRLGRVLRREGEAGARVVGAGGREEEEDEEEEEEEDEEEAGVEGIMGKEHEEGVSVPTVRIPLLPRPRITPSTSTSAQPTPACAAGPAAEALEARIDPRTGCFELCAASSSSSGGGLDAAAAGGAGEGEGEAGGARAQRLRAASERVDRERFALGLAGGAAGAGGGAGAGAAEEAWMRSVGDVVARIRASTILDDLDTLLSLLSLPLSLPSTRRLPLPAREVAKLGPNPALQAGRSALLFVPLSLPGGGAGGGAGGTGAEQWVLAFVLFEEGLRAALLRARDASDGMNAFLELVEVGWLGRAGEGEDAAGEARSAGGKGRGANLGYELRGETVLELWGQCVHRVALFELERQLSARRIPYRLCAAPAAARSPTQRDAVTAGGLVATTPRPFLLVQSGALVRLPEAERLTARDAALQGVVDAQGRIRTTLHLRLRLPLPPTALPDPAELPPGVLWNPKRGVLVLAVEDELDTAVERLLRAFALVLRTVGAAQTAAATATATASASAHAPASPSKKRGAGPVPTPKGQLKGLPNGLGV